MRQSIPKKYFQFSILIAVLLILLCCMLFVAIFAYYAHEASIGTNTIGLKQYTNVACAYSFKYPANWTVRNHISTTSTAVCSRVYLISPNNPRMFDVLGRSEYSFTISRLDSFYPQFELLRRNDIGDWEGIPAQIEKLPTLSGINREILRDMFGINDFVGGLVSSGSRAYMITLPPVSGGHKKDDWATFNGVLLSFQVL